MLYCMPDSKQKALAYAARTRLGLRDNLTSLFIREYNFWATVVPVLTVGQLCFEHAGWPGSLLTSVDIHTVMFRWPIR